MAWALGPVVKVKEIKTPKLVLATGYLTSNNPHTLKTQNKLKQILNALKHQNAVACKQL